MTDNINVISRPKVRFCQFSDNTRNKIETVENSKQQSDLRTSGLRIKEIVTLKKPIRIVDPKKFVNICDKDTSSNNIGSLSHYCTTSGNVRNISLSNKNMPKIKNTILCDANGIQNTKNSSKMLQGQNKSSQDDVLKDIAKNVRQNGKENKLLNKSASNKNVSDITTGNFQHSVQSVTRKKFKLPMDNVHIPKVNIQDFKTSKMTKPQSVSSIIKKTRNSMIEGRIFNAKPVSSHYKTMTRNKISPVKKIASRNVSGPKIKTSVGSVFRKEQADPKTSDTNERCIVALDKTTTVQDLAQPEYNSIMCTVNKLKELERQKIVANINHLPFALKSFLNGKISAALDFPLDETLYKNLIDLSIDEKQLPSTITRSKDPEPRQKDIVPQLSHFFIPEDIKEICEAVHVKLRASKIDDNWNAFKISNRILDWKYSIDDID
ncbi:PREDICTED: uncharacterized protein LOC105147532 [Acromyrmex echinatior]|uniref:Protein phosphatase 1 regulatory subunit 35 C-terminal domain-containing protein n=1 Tax=Acromyrmex echinatior TaxID=103372 RepID=F4W5R4_ACREC|nr:PREDICTED: uncharacterized protein LOC105147532 [Acromyrmex echinatior]EGI70390.1 hypothetical protein G5I_00763 [Acromyrmex echinatior]